MELPFIAEAIDSEQNLYARSAIWLYLLTGARKTEFLEAKHEHIDWELEEIKLPDTKNGRTHYIPLSKPAIELLKNLPRIDGNPYILPGLKKGHHLVNISKPWIRIRKTATIKIWQQNTTFAALIEEVNANSKAVLSPSQIYDATLKLAAKKEIILPKGVVDVRIHDCRRTMGSWLVQSGNSLHLIGKVLNHSSERTTAIYAHFGQDHVRQALEDHGEKLMIAAGKQKSDNVVPLKKTSAQAL